MALPWVVLDRVTTKDGILELRKRGERDFLITFGGLILMNSSARRSEEALGKMGCQGLLNKPDARVLVGGLGMACTLRAVLDSLSESARVLVAELNPVVVEWCNGPLAALTEGAVNDSRVAVEIGDVSNVVSKIAAAEPASLDAVIFDLYKGPHPRTDAVKDPLYGSRAIQRVRAALKKGGTFAIWGENPDAAFESRLRHAGFSVTSSRPGKGGLRHVVWLATTQG